MSTFEKRMSQVKSPERVQKVLDLAQAQEFASGERGGIHEVDRKHLLSRCIDGRNAPDNKAGIAMAGGDAGLLAAGFAAVNTLFEEKGIVITNDEVTDAVFEAIGGEKNFRYHTDSHVAPGHIEGCGHCKAMLTRSAEYGLTSEQAKKMLDTAEGLNEKYKNPKSPVCIPLKGEHEERAVFIIKHVRDIKRPKETVITRDEITDEKTQLYGLDSQVKIGDDEQYSQAFIYNDDAAVLRLSALAEALHKHVGDRENVSTQDLYDMLRAAEQHQLGLTVQALAATKPKYICYIEVGTGETFVDAT